MYEKLKAQNLAFHLFEVKKKQQCTSFLTTLHCKILPKSFSNLLYCIAENIQMRLMTTYKPYSYCIHRSTGTEGATVSLIFLKIGKILALHIPSISSSKEGAAPKNTLASLQNFTPSDAPDIAVLSALLESISILMLMFSGLWATICKLAC